MPRTDSIELPTGERIPILYEDRSVLAIDKPRGWMLVPFSWQNTRYNLQAALASSLAARDFWARSRNLRFIRYIHRLDADTTGVLLLARSQGVLKTFSSLFESRRMEKFYLAVVSGLPRQDSWTSRVKIGPDPLRHGRMKPDARGGKEAETSFHVLHRGQGSTLLEARPYSGRTHQIRIHLAQSGFPILGDDLYGEVQTGSRPLALRAVRLAYNDPFTRRRIVIEADQATFLREFGFNIT